MRHKEFKDLTFADDFMFAKVMLNEKLCKQLLEIILEVKIKKLSYPEEQKTINPSYDSKSVGLMCMWMMKKAQFITLRCRQQIRVIFRGVRVITRG